jgi:hypothetical protein
MLIGLALHVALLNAPRADSASCYALGLFSKVAIAAGGPHWSDVHELIGTGRVVSSGLSGTTRLAVDVRTGRSSLEDDLPLNSSRVVFDGRMTWQQDATLGVHALNAPDAKAAARTAAYLNRRGYLRPSSDPASMECLQPVDRNGNRYDRVVVTPKWGRSVAIWVDAATHLIVRTEEQTPTYVDTERYEDYRDVGGRVVPFRLVSQDGDPADDVTRTMASYRMDSGFRVSDFQRPPAPHNQGMLGSKDFVDSPIAVEAGDVLVFASINERGPFPFILDTGGHAILTTDTARLLGIRGIGSGVSGGGGEGTIGLQFARINSLRLGQADITNIPFLVIPYGKDFSDRGVGKAPIAGILGLEIFERYAVRIDYGRQRIRLTPFNRFAYGGHGFAKPLVFEQDIPLMRARADRVQGLFQVDTGNSGSTLFFGDFLRHHGMFARYPNGVAGASSGTGGTVSLTTHRLHTLSVGEWTMRNFPVKFVVQQKGSFSSRSLAGNMGYDVLSQFTPTFDYRDGLLYLERRSGAAVPVFNRAGFSVTRGERGRATVAAVYANSPASEGGLRKGDIVRTIGGIPISSISSEQLYWLVRGQVGSKLRLVVERGGSPRSMTLVLRDLLCNADTRTCAAKVVPQHE